MNSDLRLISRQRFVQSFTAAILHGFGAQGIVIEVRPKINADLIPKMRIPEKQPVMESSVAEVPVFQPSEPQKQISQPLVPQNLPSPPLGKKVFVTQEDLPHIAPPAPSQVTPIEFTKDYGAITSLIEDPTVTFIEFHGIGKPINITKSGRKQFTDITLSREQVKEILAKIAFAAHVPLIEGVFSAAVDNFIIHAVYSEMVDIKFVIKKQTPYALLEAPTLPSFGAPQQPHPPLPPRAPQNLSNQNVAPQPPIFYSPQINQQNK